MLDFTITQEHEIIEKKYTLYDDLPQCIRDALADPDVQDVMVNPGGRVFVHAHGKHYHVGEMSFAAMRRFCRKAASLPSSTSFDGEDQTPGNISGRRFDDESPFLSAILPNNERLEAVYPTVSVDGLTFVLRRPGPLWTLDQLHAKGSMTEAQLRAIRSACGERNIVVSGWMAAGKTTLVRAILEEPSMQALRRVSIETDAEVQMPHDGARLVASPEIDFDQIFKSVLRLNTKLIVFSEVRTPAHVWSFVDAATTGHIGVTTIHARNPLTAATRMHRIVQRVAPTPADDIATACEIVAHVEPTGDGSRRVTQVVQISTDGEKFVSSQLA